MDVSAFFQRQEAVRLLKQEMLQDIECFRNSKRSATQMLGGQPDLEGHSLSNSSVPTTTPDPMHCADERAGQEGRSNKRICVVATLPMTMNHHEQQSSPVTNPALILEALTPITLVSTPMSSSILTPSLILTRSSHPFTWALDPDATKEADVIFTEIQVAVAKMQLDAAISHVPQVHQQSIDWWSRKRAPATLYFLSSGLQSQVTCLTQLAVSLIRPPHGSDKHIGTLIQMLIATRDAKIILYSVGQIMTLLHRESSAWFESDNSRQTMADLADYLVSWNAWGKDRCEHVLFKFCCEVDVMRVFAQFLSAYRYAGSQGNTWNNDRPLSVVFDRMCQNDIGKILLTYRHCLTHIQIWLELIRLAGVGINLVRHAAFLGKLSDPFITAAKRYSDSPSMQFICDQELVGLKESGVAIKAEMVKELEVLKQLLQSHAQTWSSRAHYLTSQRIFQTAKSLFQFHLPEIDKKTESNDMRSFVDLSTTWVEKEWQCALHAIRCTVNNAELPSMSPIVQPRAWDKLKSKSHNAIDINGAFRLLGPDKLNPGCSVSKDVTEDKKKKTTPLPVTNSLTTVPPRVLFSMPLNNTGVCKSTDIIMDEDMPLVSRKVPKVCASSFVTYHDITICTSATDPDCANTKAVHVVAPHPCPLPKEECGTDAWDWDICTAIQRTHATIVTLDSHSSTLTSLRCRPVLPLASLTKSMLDFVELAGRWFYATTQKLRNVLAFAQIQEEHMRFQDAQFGVAVIQRYCSELRPLWLPCRRYVFLRLAELVHVYSSASEIPSVTVCTEGGQEATISNLTQLRQSWDSLVKQNSLLINVIFLHDTKMGKNAVMDSFIPGSEQQWCYILWPEQLSAQFHVQLDHEWPAYVVDAEDDDEEDDDEEDDDGGDEEGNEEVRDGEVTTHTNNSLLIRLLRGSEEMCLQTHVQQILSSNNTDMKWGDAERAHFSFVEEMGLGRGVDTEALRILGQSIFTSHLWSRSESSRTSLPHSIPSTNPDLWRGASGSLSNAYFCAGIVQGWAMHRQIRLPSSASPLFLLPCVRNSTLQSTCQHAKEAWTMQRLRFYDPDMAHGLSELYALNEVSIEALELTMEEPTDDPTSTALWDDLPADTPVTAINLDAYIRGRIRHHLWTGPELKQAWKYFQMGFSNSVPTWALRKLSFTMFSDQTLVHMLSGPRDTSAEFSQLEQRTQYLPYASATHPVIQWFWEIVRRWSATDEEKRRHLLIMWTSLHSIDIHMIAEKPLQIQLNDSVHKPEYDGRLPSATTCNHTLVLPYFSSASVLERQLLEAIDPRNSSSFHLG